MAIPTEDTSYHGNPNLKSIGHQHNFTKEQIKELVKCQEDPKYFIETYCQIVTLDKGLQPFKLYECQKKKVDFIMENRQTILMEGRQQGKMSRKGILIIHYLTKIKPLRSSQTKLQLQEVLSRYQNVRRFTDLDATRRKDLEQR